MTQRPRPLPAGPEQDGDTTDVRSDGRAPSAPRVRDRAVVQVLGGLDAGQVHAVGEGPLLLGRSRDCQVRLEESGVSRRHARIVRDAGRYFLEDLGSSNGTFLRGERVTRVALEHDDQFQLGGWMTLRFSMLDEIEERLLRRLYQSSVQDALTGAYSRKYFDERLHAEIAFARRHRTALAVVLFDLDDFKQINDENGHRCGDLVLARTAAAVTSVLRAEDVFARYGGEEFVVLLRGIERAGARRAAERLREVVGAQTTIFEGTRIDVTMSAGVATLACCGDDPTPERLIALADERLYRAKRAGKDRVAAE